MKPLNLKSVIWLSGTGDEINQFITDAQQKHRAVLIGHSSNIRPMLIRIKLGQPRSPTTTHREQSERRGTESRFSVVAGPGGWLAC